MTEPGPDPILAYLREHAGRYRVADLRERLLESGYDPAAVDRAVQVVQAENPPRLRELVWEKAWRVLRSMPGWW
jgi:IS5 family transposase